MSKTVEQLIEQIKQLNEYWAKGSVNGKKFQISTHDAYDHKQIHKQNPHLSSDEAKAVERHTTTDDFENGENSESTHNGHKVSVHSQGGHYDSDIIEELQDFMESAEFEQLDELSKATLGKYIKRAAGNAAAEAGESAREYEKSKFPGGIDADAKERGHSAKMKSIKRQRGISKAVSRLTKESIEAMVSAVLDGDQESASAAFNQVIGEKISERMDSIKQEIASGL